MDLIQTVISAGAETSETVGKIDNKLAGLQALLKRLSDGETTMLAKHEREYARLRDEFASERAMHGRELGLITKQLTETQAALARADDRRERAHDRAEREIINNNIVELHRAIIERNGAA